MKYPRKNDDRSWQGPRRPGKPQPFRQFGPGPVEKPAPAPDADATAPVEPGDEAPPPPLDLPPRPRMHIDLPPGVGIAYLKSASYGAFIYERMVGRVEGNVQDGDLVAVVDKRGDFFGWGFYNSRSQLALRMFSHDEAMPNDEHIALRVAKAVSFRRNLLKLDESTDAYRLVHAEGDGLSGLIADRFGEYVVIELFSLAMFRRLPLIQDAIVDSGLSVKSFIVRTDKTIADQEGFRVGNLTDVDRKDREAVITENGVRFAVRLATGHKTGFFCDQRENRLAVTAFTPSRQMLDVCCYSGGFSCYAATRGGASAVTAVDLDEAALETAARNAQLNSAAIDFQHADAFDFLRQAASQGRQWDVVVVDPSKFVARRDMIDIGLRKYADLNRLAAAVVRKNGLLLTCSCSGLVDTSLFVQTVARAVRAAGRGLQIFRITGAAPDHPFLADAPEGAYLKAIWGRME